MAVFYLKYGKAQEVAQELEAILAGGSVDSGGASDKGSSGRRLATGSIKITPEPRLNALLVLANRTDRDTIKRLLNTLDLKEKPGRYRCRAQAPDDPSGVCEGKGHRR